MSLIPFRRKTGEALHIAGVTAFLGILGLNRFFNIYIPNAFLIPALLLMLPVLLHDYLGITVLRNEAPAISEDQALDTLFRQQPQSNGTESKTEKIFGMISFVAIAAALGAEILRTLGYDIPFSSIMLFGLLFIANDVLRRLARNKR